MNESECRVTYRGESKLQGKVKSTRPTWRSCVRKSPRLQRKGARHHPSVSRTALHICSPWPSSPREAGLSTCQKASGLVCPLWRTGWLCSGSLWVRTWDLLRVQSSCCPGDTAPGRTHRCPASPVWPHRECGCGWKGCRDPSLPWSSRWREAIRAAAAAAAAAVDDEADAAGAGEGGGAAAGEDDAGWGGLCRSRWYSLYRYPREVLFLLASCWQDHQHRCCRGGCYPSVPPLKPPRNHWFLAESSEGQGLAKSLYPRSGDCCCHPNHLDQRLCVRCKSPCLYPEENSPPAWCAGEKGRAEEGWPGRRCRRCWWQRWTSGWDRKYSASTAGCPPCWINLYPGVVVSASWWFYPPSCLAGSDAEGVQTGLQAPPGLWFHPVRLGTLWAGAETRGPAGASQTGAANQLCHLYLCPLRLLPPQMSDCRLDYRSASVRPDPFLYPDRTVRVRQRVHNTELERKETSSGCRSDSEAR